MAVDIFLELEGDQGRVQGRKHTETIDVLSWSWGCPSRAPPTWAAAPAPARFRVQDINFTHYIDKSSPTLMLLCCNGKHIKKGEAHRPQGRREPARVLTVELEDILVSHVSTGGSHGEDRLTENVTLNFAKFKLEYSRSRRTARAAPKIEVEVGHPAEPDNLIDRGSYLTRETTSLGSGITACSGPSRS